MRYEIFEECRKTEFSDIFDDHLILPAMVVNMRIYMHTFLSFRFQSFWWKNSLDCLHEMLFNPIWCPGVSIETILWNAHMSISCFQTVIFSEWSSVISCATARPVRHYVLMSFWWRVKSDEVFTCPVKRIRKV